MQRRSFLASLISVLCVPFFPKMSVAQEDSRLPLYAVWRLEGSTFVGVRMKDLHTGDRFVLVDGEGNARGTLWRADSEPYIASRRNISAAVPDEVWGIRARPVEGNPVLP